MLLVTRGNWVIPVAVGIADLAVRPMDDDLNAFIDGMPTPGVDCFALGAMKRRRSLSPLASKAPAIVPIRDDVIILLLAHGFLL
jgi:hypothetical protein